MTSTDQQVLEDSVHSVIDLPRRDLFIRAGDIVNTSALILEGFVCRYLDDREGYRQIVAIHVPGDFVGLHGYAMKKLDHDIATLTPTRLALVDHSRLAYIKRDFPNLTRLLWLSTLLDAAIHRQWIFRLGRLDSAGRVAHLLSELSRRLEMVGLVEGGAFTFPVTQIDLAEACGITSVHMNRVLRSLREKKIVTVDTGRIEIHDYRALHRAGSFNDEYLYPDAYKLVLAAYG